MPRPYQLAAASTAFATAICLSTVHTDYFFATNEQTTDTIGIDLCSEKILEALKCYG